MSLTLLFLIFCNVLTLLILTHFLKDNKEKKRLALAELDDMCDDSKQFIMETAKSGCGRGAAMEVLTEQKRVIAEGIRA